MNKENFWGWSTIVWSGFVHWVNEVSLIDVLTVISLLSGIAGVAHTAWIQRQKLKLVRGDDVSGSKVSES